MLFCCLGKQAHRIRAVCHCRRICWVIEYHRLCARSYRCIEALFFYRKALACVGRNLDAHSSGKLDLLSVHRKIWRENKHLVAGVENAEHNKRHSKAARRSHQDALRLDRLPKVLAPCAAKSVYKLRVAVRIAVVGVPCLRVAEGGADYFLIGHDVRIADTEVY